MKSEESSIKHGIKDYIETKLDIIKLNVVDKSSSALSGIIIGAGLFLIGLFVLTFLSFTLAYAISDAIGKTYSGFLVVAGFYILTGIVFFLLKEKLVTLPIVNTLLKKVYKKEN